VAQAQGQGQGRGELTAVWFESNALLTNAGTDITVTPALDTNTVPSECVVWLKSTLTAALAPGFYTNRLRVVTYLARTSPGRVLSGCPQKNAALSSGQFQTHSKTIVNLHVK
jgi:hypothetical protein